jgi:hypothetical protein
MPGATHESIVKELCMAYGCQTTGFMRAVRRHITPILDQGLRPDAWLETYRGFITFEVEVSCWLTPERVTRWACLWVQLGADGVDLELHCVTRDMGVREVNLRRELEAAVVAKQEPARLARDYGDCLVFTRGH